MKTAPVLCIALMAAAVSVAAAQDPLASARDLYAAAAYEEALAHLDRASASGAVPMAAREIEQYRAFCLFALGRTREAEATLEALIRKDPFVTLDRRDASPRIESMFVEVRNRLLPHVVREEYRTARALAQEKSPEAGQSLRRVKDLLALAEQTDVWDSTLADLRMLVDGFLELHAAAEPPASPAAPTGGMAPVRNLDQAVADGAAPADAAGREAATDRPVGTSGTSVTQPPVVIAQPAPVIPPNLRAFVLASQRIGTYDVLITESGTVRDVVVRESVSPAYDRLFVQTARTWKYRPAMRDGKPVASLKRVTVQAAKQ